MKANKKKSESSSPKSKIKFERPKEIFYVMSHGARLLDETLTSKQRFGIPIIYIGTEGKTTYAGPTAHTNTRICMKTTDFAVGKISCKMGY